jgi:hypothetical protein
VGGLPDCALRGVAVSDYYEKYWGLVFTSEKERENYQAQIAALESKLQRAVELRASGDAQVGSLIQQRDFMEESCRLQLQATAAAELERDYMKIERGALQARLDVEQTEYQRLISGLMKLYPADTNGDTGVVEGIRAELERRQTRLEEVTRECQRVKSARDRDAQDALVVHARLEEVTQERSHWRAEFEETCCEVGDLKARLARAEGLLRLALYIKASPELSRQIDEYFLVESAPAEEVTRFPPADAKTTDYCSKCGDSPESGSHLFDHDYEPPKPAAQPKHHWDCSSLRIDRHPCDCQAAQPCTCLGPSHDAVCPLYG